MTGGLERGFYSLLFLARALAKRRIFTPIRLCAVSTGLHDVTGDELLCPANAPLLGVLRTVAQEYPNIAASSIDVILPATGSAGENGLAERLIGEFGAATAEPIVAYRGARRWVQRFTPHELPPVPPEREVLRERGVYLITGGLGALGLSFAEHLAWTCRARLVLTSRTPFPEETEWTAVLSDPGADDATRHRIRALQALRDHGADVVVVTADVTDAAQLQGAVASARNRFGAIHGVIHAAGVMTERAIRTVTEASRDDCEAQFAPKVHGTLHLARALDGIDLDFCVLTSSIAAILGGLGFAGYAGANAFLDAYARWRRQARAGGWISVNWDAWSVGGGVRFGDHLTDLAISPQEGVELLRRILSSAAWPQIVVSTTSMAARVERWVRGGVAAHRQTAADNGCHARPTLRTAYAAPENAVQQAVAAVWQDAFGLDRIGIDDDFFELGGHSLLAVRIGSLLRELFHVDVPLRAFFETPTIAVVSEKLVAIGEESGIDVQRIAGVVCQIGQLSPAEVESMLAERTAPPDDGALSVAVSA